MLQGAAEYPAYVRFRQNSQFFYLTGVEVPRALVLLDGRTKTATLFVAPRNERMERSEGPVLVPGDEAARLTGIAQVRERDAFADALKTAATAGRTLYIPHRAESLGAATPQAAASHAAATTKDPWDGRLSRAAQFIQKITEAAPAAKVADLDPILDGLRLIKSPREIALVREATGWPAWRLPRRSAVPAPGQRENDLEAIADYVFKQGGAQGFAYFALAAAGKNAHYPHYHGGEAELKSGDLVLFDYAPDYRYYSSDVTRMFPVSGHFSPEQKERYTVYLRMYQALMESIKPRVAPRDIIRDAVMKMDRIVAAFSFSYRREQAGRGRLRRAVSQEHPQQPRPHGRHGSPRRATGLDVLLPGMIFTIEPALTIPDERVYIRLEDVILITETGYENLSSFLPMEPDAIERLMAETGRFEEQPLPVVRSRGARRAPRGGAARRWGVGCSPPLSRSSRVSGGGSPCARIRRLALPREGRDLQARGEKAAAISRYQEALAAAPSRVDVRFFLGQLLLDGRRASEAIPHLNAAVEAGVRDDAAPFDLARALASIGDQAAAQRALARLKVPPQADTASFASAGQLAEGLGDAPLAIQFYSQAAERADVSAQVVERLGVLLASSGRARDAITVLERGLARAP